VLNSALILQNNYEEKMYYISILNKYWSSNDDDDDDDNFYGAVAQHMPLQRRLDTKPCHKSEIRFLKIVCFESGLERVHDRCRQLTILDSIQNPPKEKY